MQSFLKNNRQAPRKVRLIARAIVGKYVPVALAELTFMPHKGAKTLSKLIVSAVENAKHENANTNENTLMVKNITVDKGLTLKRYMPRAFGRASAIHKESSHIRVFLAEIAGVKEVTVKPSIKKAEKAQVEVKEKKGKKSPTSATSSVKTMAVEKAMAGKEEKEVAEIKKVEEPTEVVVSEESVKEKETATK